MNLKNLLNNKGLSIFIAVGFMGAIILISLGVSSVMTLFLTGSGNVEIMNQSYFAAEGRVEDAYYDITEHMSGYENKDNWDDREDFYEDNRTQSNWKIEALTYENPFENDAFTIPPPGEGTADDRDWNKISMGESVSIDLFQDSSSSGTETLDDDIINISAPEYAFQNFKLRLRTPLIEGIRPDLLLIESEDIDVSLPDDTVINWTFSAVDKNNPDTIYQLSEMTDYSKTKPLGGDLVIEREEENSTEVIESKINAHNSLNDYYVIDTSDLMDPPYNGDGSSLINRGVDKEGIQRRIDWFLKDEGGLDLHKYNFKFSLVSQLFDALESGLDKKVIPHLEYQIQIDASEPIPDEYITITANGYAGSFKQTIVSKIRQQGGLSLLDYVVFQ